jgi:3-hydroxyisobutyrate dehydrogenase-like beta-hydroxyacid dehydrogenase
MGHGLAACLLRAGYSVSFLSHQGNQDSKDLLEVGAASVDSIAALCERSDWLLICVTGSPEVEAIVLGPNGVLQSSHRPELVIDFSTAIPDSTVKLAKAFASQSILFMDAAMTRTPKEAAEGRLNLLVGAEEATFQMARPLLEKLAENITHAGGVGAGHRLKLLHNFVSLGSVALLSEAAACADAMGISLEVFADTLEKGGGRGAALERVRPFWLEGDPRGLRFTVANAAKDLSYYLEMSAQTSVAAPIARGVSAQLEGFQTSGSGNRLMPELYRLMREASGPAR